MIYDDDADLGLLEGKTVAIIGYGSQGHAHALNLLDSGVSVVVGLREGSSSIEAAKEAGLEVAGLVEAASRGDVVMILAPDELHHEVWEQIRDGMADGKALLFAHGLSIHYGEVEPPPGVDVALVAPKGPGHLVRRLYIEGSGVPASSRCPGRTGEARDDRAGLGQGHRLDPRRRDPDDLQGGDGDGSLRRTGRALRRRGALVQAGFETLVAAGYQPEMAYFECLHELKLICDLMYEKRLAGMRFSISNTAEYGDITRGKRVITEQTRANMQRHPHRDPVRRVRARVDCREPRRPGELQAHARRAGRYAGRGSRTRATLAYGLDQADLLMLAYVFWHRPAEGVAADATGRARALSPFAGSPTAHGIPRLGVVAAPAPTGWGRSRLLRTGTSSRTSPRWAY